MTPRPNSEAPIGIIEKARTDTKPFITTRQHAHFNPRAFAIYVKSREVSLIELAVVLNPSSPMHVFRVFVLEAAPSQPNPYFNVRLLMLIYVSLVADVVVIVVHTHTHTLIIY